ncbi:hypothetical protein CHS0354_042657 [Potamilus streckersoni]|uniref:Uncharacterized protein n=1 Tax=Potamilus streckersoni TaxID=2493646 RepID=A0AAE0TE41_9BIVA|nr:hypothetical protein CHS0354_042657 [Potamilus streckersoni]
MAVGTVICLIVIFLPLSKQNDIDSAIHSVLSAVESLVNYYTNNYQNLNIDGLYGLRVLEGHFEAIINGSNGRYKHLTTEILQRLMQMKKEATRICSLAMEHVKNDDLGYYQIMNFVIGRPWEIFHDKQKKVDGRLRWEPPVYRQAQSEAKLDERSSDECMAELTGAMAKDKKKCSISNKCLGLMTYPGMIGYGLTHQILWTMLAEKAGCFEILDQMLRQYNSSISMMQQELCSNNYIQMTEAVKKLRGKIIPRFQDLFLEQLFICPSIGFYEFLDLKILPQILSWQKKSGCFGIMPKLSKEELAKLDLSVLADLKSGDYDYLEDKHSVSDNGGMVAHSHPLHFEGMHQDAVNFKGPPQNQVQHGQFPAVDLKTVPNFVNLQMNQFKNLNKQNVVNLGSRKLLSTEGFHNSFEGLVHQNRRLLAEKSLGGGCLSHKTAVAAGALVMYLRHLLDPDAIQTFNRSARHSEGLPSERLQSLHRNLKKLHKTSQKSGNVAVHKDDNFQLQGDYRNNQVQPPILGHEGKDGHDVQMPWSSHKLGLSPFGVPNHNLYNNVGGMDQNEDKFGDINIPHKMIHYRNGGDDNGEGGNNNAGNGGGGGGDNYYDGDEEHATYNEEDDGDYNEDDNAEDNTYKDDVAGDNHIDQNPPDRVGHVGNKKIDNHSFHNNKKVEVKDEDRYGDDDNADKDDNNYYDDNEENMKEHKKGDNSHNQKNSVHNVVAQHFKEEIKLVDVSQDSPSFKMLGFVFVLCLTGLLLLMYRFIKKRRIHIRYSPRTTYRV